MKHLLSTALLLVAMCSPFSAQAQAMWRDKHQQVHLSLGVFSTNMFEDLFEEIHIKILKDEGSKLENSGAFTLGYMYNFNSHFSAGFDVAYERSVAKGKKKNTKDVFNHWSFMPTIRAYWFQKDHFAMYSKFAYGLNTTIYKWDDIRKDDTEHKWEDSHSRSAFQVSPVCAEFGGQVVRGFYELGFGEEGLFLGGIRYSF